MRTSMRGPGRGQRPTVTSSGYRFPSHSFRPSPLGPNQSRRSNSPRPSQKLEVIVLQHAASGYHAAEALSGFSTLRGSRKAGDIGQLWLPLHIILYCRQMQLEEHYICQTTRPVSLLVLERCQRRKPSRTSPLNCISLAQQSSKHVLSTLWHHRGVGEPGQPTNANRAIHGYV